MGAQAISFLNRISSIKMAKFSASAVLLAVARSEDLEHKRSCDDLCAGYNQPWSHVQREWNESTDNPNVPKEGQRAKMYCFEGWSWNGETEVDVECKKSGGSMHYYAHGWESFNGCSKFTNNGCKHFEEYCTSSVWDLHPEGDANKQLALNNICNVGRDQSVSEDECYKKCKRTFEHAPDDQPMSNCPGLHFVGGKPPSCRDTIHSNCRSFCQSSHWKNNCRRLEESNDSNASPLIV